jgi:hypothetical protein
VVGQEFDIRFDCRQVQALFFSSVWFIYYVVYQNPHFSSGLNKLDLEANRSPLRSAKREAGFYLALGHTVLYQYHWQMYVCQIVRKCSLTTGSTDRTVFFRSSHCDACSKAQFLGSGRSSVDRRIRRKEARLFISSQCALLILFLLSGFKLNG